MSNNGKARPKSDRYSLDGAAPSGRRPSSTAGSAAGEQRNPDQSPLPKLSAEDAKHLKTFEEKLQLVRDRTIAVSKGYHTGFDLYGPGGVSKSYTVLSTLQQIGANYHLSNSRLTGRGLFDTLMMYPDCTHVIEDAEPLWRDKNAIGVVRSALAGQRRGGVGPMERWVTWSAYRVHLEFLFTGGIIFVGNRPMLELPELQACQTRLPSLLLQPTDCELRAMMRSISIRGYQDEAGREMDTEECLKVCEFVIAESQALHRPLSLRLLINSFHDYLMWQEGDAGVHWKDAIAAAVRMRPTVFRSEVDLGPRAARKARELEIVREILAKTSDRAKRFELWNEATGGAKSEKALYRRMLEVQKADSHFLKK